MKKGLSILLALVLLCCTLSVGASAAAQPDVLRSETRSYTIDRKDPRQQKAQKFSSFAPQYKGAEDPNTPFTYYSGLNANAKAIYDSVVSVQNLQASFTVTLPNPYRFSAYVTENGFDMPEAVLNQYADAVFNAFSAAVFDHPEQFWLSGFDIYEEFNYRQVQDNYCDFELVSVVITLMLPNGYTSWDTVKSDYNKMMQTAKSVPLDGTTRFDKLKSIHDWVAANATYDYDFNDVSYYAVTVFVGSKKVVCEGYSEAFKILCDLAGIPCTIAVSDDHEWNHVKMEDGNWYAVDVTWDDQDQDNLLFYEYFLVGSSTIDIHYGNETFAQGHVYTGNIYGDYRLSSPAIFDTAYLPMFLAVNSTASVDRTAKTVYLAQDDTVNNALQAAYGTSFRLSADGKTLEIYKGNTLVDTYKVLHFVAGFGDVNGDGKVNAVDARWVLQAASGARTLTAEQTANANVNGDSKVNAVDARWILQVASGARKLAA